MLRLCYRRVKGGRDGERVCWGTAYICGCNTEEVAVLPVAEAEALRAAVTEARAAVAEALQANAEVGNRNIEHMVELAALRRLREALADDALAVCGSLVINEAVDAYRKALLSRMEVRP
jgi:hypothetical protein